ncbi:MAG: GIY-YIG nuclease family protein [Bacteroidota bacterium]
MFYVYVLYSKSLSKRYVGSSSNINKRLSEHNSGKSKFTKGGIPGRLIYSEQFDTNSEARKREIFLKSGNGRKFLDSILTSATESSEPDLSS